jgi:hypothetical protein
MTDPNLKIVIDIDDRVTTGLQKIMAATEDATSKIKDGFEEAGTAVTKVQECFEDVSGTNEKVASGFQKVEERFNAFRQATEDLNAAVKELNDSFMHGEEAKLSQREQFLKDWINLLGKEYEAKETHEKLLADAGSAREKIVSKSYQSMTEEMLRLVEVGNFSAKEFGKTVMQQVKIELAGLAARAAVNALYQTAVGFALLLYSPDRAALAFKSAATFAAVSGASLAAAAGVQSLLGGQDSGGGAGAGSGTTARSLSSGGPVPVRSISENTSGANASPTQNITIHVHNPLSTQNWSEIVENDLVPALKEVAGRNVSVEIKNV